MKTLFFFICSLNFAWAKPTVTILDKNFPKKEIKASYLVEPKPNPRKYIDSKKRDVVLSKYYGKQMSKMDDLDRDIFYKSIVNYDFSRLQKKYPFVQKATVEKMKNELSL